MVLAFVAGAAPAQQVFKCVNGKSVTYQSEPCLPGQAVKAWDAVPEQRNYENEARIEAMRQQLRGNSYQPRQLTPHSTGARVSVSRNDSQCQIAKANREVVYKAAGLRRTFAVSRLQDDLVHEACK
ncbi:DUF4124 domain-containing protein [Xanthomonas sp. Kuri4-1]